MQRSLDYFINLHDGSFNSGMTNAVNKTKHLDGLFTKLAGSAAAFFSIQQGAEIVKETSEIAMRIEALDTQLKSFSGNEYAQNVALIKTVTKDLNLPLLEANEGFTKFNASASQAGLTGDKTRKTFLGLSMAARVYQLDGQKFERATTALEQMLSKGKVSAEELRGQLGEHIPGAFALAARSMGISQEELNKRLESGSINAIDFVSKFADQMVTEYAGRIPEAMKTAKAITQGLNNTLIEHKARLGDDLTPVQIKWLQLQIMGYEAMQKAVAWAVRNKEMLKTTAVVIGVVAGSVLGYMAVQKASMLITSGWAIAQTVAATVSALLAGNVGRATAGLRILNLTMLANPAFLITAGIIALATAVVIGYKEFDKFRAVVDGVWEVVKSKVGGMVMIFKAMIAPIKALWLAATGDIEGAQKALSKGVISGIEGAKRLLENPAEAFNRGYDASMKRSEEAANQPKKKSLWEEFFDGNNNNSGSGNTGGTTKPTNTTVSSGRSVRNISVVIQKIENNLEVHNSRVSEPLDKMKRDMVDALNRTVMDLESSL